MKVLAITLALSGIALAAPLNAQILPTSRIPTSSRSTTVDGSWRAVGRDGNGNAVYERSVRDANGNIVIQRARRDANGNLVIISSRTVRDNDRRNCDYNRTTNSIGDIIFGRSNDVSCDDRGNRDDGSWYQVGRGRDNNSIYERRTRDANGNLVIQRARRNPNGTFTIFSTRVANENDKQWKKAQKEQRKAYQRSERLQDKEMRDRLKAGTITKDQYEAWKRSDKQQDKIDRDNEKGQREARNGSNPHKGKGKRN